MHAIRVRVCILVHDADMGYIDALGVFEQVTLADQTRKTKLQLLISDSIRFRTSFIFPVTAPLRQQEVQLRLFRASASKAHGRLVRPSDSHSFADACAVDLPVGKTHPLQELTAFCLGRGLNCC
jgi:hypothetical protein